MTKDEALKLALEALEATTTAQNKLAASKHAEWLWLKTKGLSHKEEEELKDAYYAAEKEAAAVARRRDSLSVEAVSVIKQALAAPVQEPVAWMHEWDDGERVPMLRKRDVDSSDIDSPKSVRPLVFGDTTPPPQRQCNWPTCQSEEYQQSLAEQIKQELVTGAAQPSVPDAMTSADIQEHIEYVAGWNDCRQAMLEMMK